MIRHWFVLIRHWFVTDSLLIKVHSLIRHWFATDSPLIRHWFVTDSSLIRHWFATDSPLIRHWFAIDSPLIRHWFVTDHSLLTQTGTFAELLRVGRPSWPKRTHSSAKAQLSTKTRTQRRTTTAHSMVKLQHSPTAVASTKQSKLKRGIAEAMQMYIEKRCVSGT